MGTTTHKTIIQVHFCQIYKCSVFRPEIQLSKLALWRHLAKFTKTLQLDVATDIALRIRLIAHCTNFTVYCLRNDDETRWPWALIGSFYCRRYIHCPLFRCNQTCFSNVNILPFIPHLHTYLDISQVVFLSALQQAIYIYYLYYLLVPMMMLAYFYEISDGQGNETEPRCSSYPPTCLI